MQTISGFDQTQFSVGDVRFGLDDVTLRHSACLNEGLVRGQQVLGPLQGAGIDIQAPPGLDQVPVDRDDRVDRTADGCPEREDIHFLPKPSGLQRGSVDRNPAAETRWLRCRSCVR